MSEITDHNAAFGNSPEKWRERLSSSLGTGDHAELKSVLNEFRKEIKAETKILSQAGQSPLLDRLLEQARRLLQSAPTENEGLKAELTKERKLWADFRKKYREAFVPEKLHPYIDDLGLFVTPSKDGPSYEGFDKYIGYGGGDRREVVTLFDPHQIEDDGCGYKKTLPNFYTSFFKYERRFIVHRAYRVDLPCGAGEECLFEHIEMLAKSPIDLLKLTFENVKNSETYDVFVTCECGDTRLVNEPEAVNAPLVRLGQRLIERTGKSIGEVKVSLDPFGFLDLHIEAI